VEREQPVTGIGLTERQRGWLDVLLILATVIAFFIATGLVASAIYAFGDVILIFFLAWLIAFMIAPLARGLGRLLPWLDQRVAVVLVYVVLLLVLIGAIFFIAETLVNSINEFIARLPTIEEDLAALLLPIQEWLDRLGLGVNVQVQLDAIVAAIRSGAIDLLGPLQQLAVAGIGVVGNLLFVVILSVYIAVDRDRITSFLLRLVPPRFGEEADVVIRSTNRSFGGFIRGQIILGLSYGAVAFLTSVVFGLEFGILTALAAGVLMAIPFFGPFVAWAPPVLAAIALDQGAIIPTLVAMGAGWFVVMNIVQPRVMAGTIGIHPIVVLASVIIGAKIAGIAGAIFGIPIAAIASSLFLHFLGRSRGGTVTERAARRVEDREGRHVRVPREPMAGLDQDIAESEGPDRASGADSAASTPTAARPVPATDAPGPP
jgi:predicted PurR-regulated permease PerM